VPVERRSGRRPPAILLAGAAALAAAAIAAILIAGGGSDPPARSTASTAKRSGTSTTSKKKTTTTGASATTTTPAAAPSSGTPTTPAAAVRAFYGRAAAHNYESAWALAAPSLRSQLQGYGAFQRQFSTVRSIVFGRVQTVRQTDSAATVAFTTTATHTDHVDRCTGTAETAPGSGGGWVVTHISPSCRTESSG
jgi:hypothetical protein